MASDPKTEQTIRLKNKCYECDGTGCYDYCDDYLEGVCIVGWEMPCDNCEGRGWNYETIPTPDKKWARMWKEINH